MLASVAFIIGIGVAVFLMVVLRRRTMSGDRPDGSPTGFGRLSLVIGVFAVLCLVLGSATVTQPGDLSFGLFLLSIAAGFAGVTLAIAGLIFRDRHWPTWVGLVISFLPVAFWLAFAIANLLSPAV